MRCLSTSGRHINSFIAVRAAARSIGLAVIQKECASDWKKYLQTVSNTLCSTESHRLPDDNLVKEIIQALEDGDRKRSELQTRLQDKEDRYREKVKRLTQSQRSLPKESENERMADRGQQAVGSQ